MNRKRIVFLADCLVTQKAGIYYYTKQFIKRVIEQYPNNEYAVLVPKPTQLFDIEEIIVPIKTWLPFHLRIRSFGAIPKAIKKHQANMVIEMAHFGPFLLPDHIRRVTCIHDITPLLYPEWHDKISHYGHKWTLGKIIKKAEHIIVNSAVTKKDVESYYPASKNKVSIAYPAILSTLETHSKSSTPQKYFLAVGTIEPRKNYLLLLDAFESIAADDQEIKLFIVGHKGWKSANVFDRINNSAFKDRIIVEGYVNEDRIKLLYKNALAFIFPTLYEGFGMPLLEAMSFGIPIVCSDIDICREVCGDAATYFKNKSDLIELMQASVRGQLRESLYSASIKDRANYFNKSPLSLDMIFG